MLRTRFCERFGIEAPIVVAPMGPDLTGPELVAAVCDAGGFRHSPGTTLPAADAATADPPSSHAHEPALWRELRSKPVRPSRPDFPRCALCNLTELNSVD